MDVLCDRQTKEGMIVIRIGICDDIYDARLMLRAALEQIFEGRGLMSTTVEFSSGERALR